jgi:hypothetical protein
MDEETRKALDALTQVRDLVSAAAGTPREFAGGDLVAAVRVLIEDRAALRALQQLPVEAIAQQLADALDARLPPNTGSLNLAHLALRQCVRWVQDAEGHALDWNPRQRGQS